MSGGKLFRIASVLIASIILVQPSIAHARTGCATLKDIKDRSECEARMQARSQARAEVERRLGRKDIKGEYRVANSQSSSWRDAVKKSKDLDLGSIIFSRTGAMMFGLIWLAMSARGNLTRHRVSRRSR